MKLFVITVIIVMLSNILIDLDPSNRRTDTSRLDTELDSQNRDTIPKNIIYREFRKNETSHSKEKGKAKLRGMRYPPKGSFFENSEMNPCNRKPGTKHYIKNRAHEYDPQARPINIHIKLAGVRIHKWRDITIH